MPFRTSRAAPDNASSLPFAAQATKNLSLAEVAHRAAVRFAPNPTNQAGLGRCLVLQAVASRDAGEPHAAQLEEAARVLEEARQLAGTYGVREDIDRVRRALALLEKATWATCVNPNPNSRRQPEPPF